MTIERILRNSLQDLFTYRDGYRGVNSARKELRSFINKDFRSMEAACSDGLREIVNHAFTTTSYYHDRWEEIGFGGLTRSDYELKSLPLLTKEIIEKNKEKMISAIYRKEDLEVSYTGGSSGTPTSTPRSCTMAWSGAPAAGSKSSAGFPRR